MPLQSHHREKLYAQRIDILPRVCYNKDIKEIGSVSACNQNGGHIFNESKKNEARSIRLVSRASFDLDRIFYSCAPPLKYASFLRTRLVATHGT